MNGLELAKLFKTGSDNIISNDELAAAKVIRDDMNIPKEKTPIKTEALNELKDE